MGDCGVILLDVGGVLVRLTSAERLAAMGAGETCGESVEARWNRSSAIRRLETGRCRIEDFAREAVAEMGLTVTPEAFLEEFLYFPKDYLPDARETLQELSRRHSLACFSNTNAYQWARLRDELGIEQYFEKIFLSYDLGVMKPDPAAFAKVIAGLGRPPDEIAFFDDNPANVSAGNACGMRAFPVDTAQGLRSALRAQGILLGIARQSARGLSMQT